LGAIAGIRIWVLYQLYQVTYRSVGLTTVGELTVPMTVWALALIQSVFLSTGTRLIIRELSDDIIAGNIAYIINRPYSLPLYIYFSTWGRVIARIIPTLMIGSLVAFVLVGPLRFTFAGLAGGIILLFLGLSLNALLSICIGLLAFWMEDVSAVRWIYDKVQWALGGIVIPVALFPDKWRTIAEVLPFPHLFYTPAQIMVNFNADKFFYYLILQVIWIAVISALCAFIYRRGIKNVSINGG
jgi:ABC-2 type transport system permease protein